MLNIQYIKAQFESAFPLAVAETYPIVFSIFGSGSYNDIPFATDNFITYDTGVRTFFSGSGYWLGSGYSSNENRFVYDGMEEYPTGNGYTGATLTGAVFQSGNSTFAITGYVWNVTVGIYDQFEEYPTGALYNRYTGLNLGTYQFGYATTSGATTGQLFNYLNTGYVRSVWVANTWAGTATGYFYNLSNISGLKTIETLSYTGYSGSHYFVQLTGFEYETAYGFTYTTGAAPAIPSLFDNFASYATGFYSGAFLVGNTFNTGIAEVGTVTGTSERQGVIRYVEMFNYYPTGITITSFTGGVIFYDYMTGSYVQINYGGKGGVL